MDRSRASGSSAAVFSVLDVETTGLSPRHDRVLELAIVRLDARGKVVDEWSSRFNPQGPVGATHIHGITDADVRDAPLISDLLGVITSKLAGTVLVAHNARFDLNFLRSEYARAGWQWPEPPSLCTMKASWHYSPDLSRRRLTDCCADSGVNLAQAHSALGDARAASALLANWLRRHPVYPALDPALSQRLAVTWPAGATSEPALVGASSPARPRSSAPAPSKVTATPKPKAPALGSYMSRVTFQIGSADVDVPDDDRIAVSSYLEKLTEAVADGVLTDEEVAHLADLAEVYELDPGTVANAHRVMVESLALMAVLDSKVTASERAELRHLAGQLGVPEKDLRTILADQREQLVRHQSRDLAPLPADWSLGEPVRVGDKVAFTGGEPAARAQMEELATQAGLEVMSSVSRFTTLLVSDGTSSTKTIAADKHGVRTVSFTEFRELVRWRQPPLPQ